MKTAILLSKPMLLVLSILLLINFNAFAQKTTIWIVNHAEVSDNGDALSAIGQDRATDLMKALKHENITAIYISGKNASLQTANPLAGKKDIKPLFYADSLQKFADMIKRNYRGKNVLIVADYKTILPLISAFGAGSPFENLDKGDYDQLFSIRIKGTDDPECFVRYYGKKDHVSAIPQSYMLNNFSPGVPGN